MRPRYKRTRKALSRKVPGTVSKENVVRVKGRKKEHILVEIPRELSSKSSERISKKERAAIIRSFANFGRSLLRAPESKVTIPGILSGSKINGMVAKAKGHGTNEIIKQIFGKGLLSELVRKKFKEYVESQGISLKRPKVALISYFKSENWNSDALEIAKEYAKARHQ